MNSVTQAMSFSSARAIFSLALLLQLFQAAVSQGSLRGLANAPQITFVAQDVPNYSLGRCQGDCDDDDNCSGDLVCFKRDANQPVPGCSGNFNDFYGDDFCIRREDHPDYNTAPQLHFVASDVPNGSLGRCQGDCDGDENCSGDLVCFKRDGTQQVPGCSGNHNAFPGDDYCVRKVDHPDYDGNGSNNNSSNNSGGSGGGGGLNSGVRIVSSSANWQAAGDFSLSKPNDIQVGDLMLLMISRSDDQLPIKRAGWNAVASCFKDDNADPTCALHTNCNIFDGDYCTEFQGGRAGLDLASIVFTKEVTQGDINSWNMNVNLRHDHPGWAVLAVVRGANNSNPVRGFATRSCDGIRQTVFPNVPNAQSGDLLVGYMAFDDMATQAAFSPPPGMSWAGYVYGTDETGVLYQQRISSSGATGTRTTTGNGGNGLCKDATISMLIRA